VTTTFMGGRRGPPDGDERPLRGLPGGRARPRPSPPETPPPDDQSDRQAPGEGARPGRQAPGNGGRSGGGGSDDVVRPLRPLRVVPGGAPPPLRVIPGGAGAPTGLADGDGQASVGGDAPGGAPTTVRPRPPVAVGRGANRRRWVAAILALALVVGLAVTGLVVAERPRTSAASSASATTVTPGSVAPARPSPVAATIGTGGFSYAMAAGAGALWVAGSDEVTRIDPATNSVTARIPVGATGSGPAAVAVGAGAVWVPVAVPGALWAIDPASDKVTARISLGGPLGGPISVSAAGGSVWVACCGPPDTGPATSSGRLLRVDPRRKRVVADIPLPARPVALAADASAAWVATAGGQVLMVSSKRNRIAATIAAGGPLGFSQTIAVGPGGVWLADPFDEQIVRIDPRTRRVMARIPAGPVTTLAVTGEAVWALSPLGLVRIDPARDRVAAIGSDPDLRRARLVAADAAGLWTAGWSSISRIDPDLVTP
jgi:YVTN family beta-propeller protein